MRRGSMLITACHPSLRGISLRPGTLAIGMTYANDARCAREPQAFRYFRLGRPVRFGHWVTSPGLAKSAVVSSTRGVYRMTASRPASTVAYAEDLVRRIRENEADAFDELYSRYSPRVFGYLFQRLNGNLEEAEDLTAEVFTKVYEKIDRFQVQGAPLSAWLFRIAHNRLIDSVRRRPKQTQVTLEDAPALTAGPVFGGIDQAMAMDQIKT